jgi:hypothetical protein
MCRVVEEVGATDKGWVDLNRGEDIQKSPFYPAF